MCQNKQFYSGSILDKLDIKVKNVISKFIFEI